MLLRFASDERLVEAVGAGSERAFEALFDRHHAEVRAFCRRLLGSSEEAEDAAQATFFAAYRELARCRLPLAVRPWLLGIARNRCLAALRARRERPVEALPEPASDHVGAQVVRREEVRGLLADLARLPHDQRTALVLAELGDLSHEDIAQVLGCPRAKVKALVFQARESLAATRDARETPCAEIREQLATLRGAALRRTTLRRHLRDCAACRRYRDEVRAQRRGVAAFVPVAPAMAFKRWLVEALSGSEGAAAASAGGMTLGGVAATALVTLAIPLGGIAVLHDGAAPERAGAQRSAAGSAALDRVPAVAARREEPHGGALRSAGAGLSRRAAHPTASGPAQAQSHADAGCSASGCAAKVDHAPAGAAAVSARPQQGTVGGGRLDGEPSSGGADAASTPAPVRRAGAPPSERRGPLGPASPVRPRRPVTRGSHSPLAGPPAAPSRPANAGSPAAPAVGAAPPVRAPLAHRAAPAVHAAPPAGAPSRTPERTASSDPPAPASGRPAAPPATAPSPAPGGGAAGRPGPGAP